MKKILIMVLVGVLFAADNSVCVNYEVLSRVSDEQIQGRLKKAFERRASVMDFRSLESEDERLPDQPEKPGDATRLLEAIYEAALLDLRGLLHKRDKFGIDVERNLSVAFSVAAETLRMNSYYTSILHDMTTPSIRFLFPDAEEHSLADCIKKLLSFKKEVVLAYADQCIDIRAE